MPSKQCMSLLRSTVSDAHSLLLLPLLHVRVHILVHDHIHIEVVLPTQQKKGYL